MNLLEIRIKAPLRGCFARKLQKVFYFHRIGQIKGVTNVQRRQNIRERPSLRKRLQEREEVKAVGYITLQLQINRLHDNRDGQKFTQASIYLQARIKVSIFQAPRRNIFLEEQDL